MKILIISDEVWNDRIHGNNMLSNWFEGFNAELANIYCSPGEPLNSCCKEYFQITDKMMFKSIMFGRKAGLRLPSCDYSQAKRSNCSEKEDKKLYGFLKSISTETLRAIRELLWVLGRYDEDAIEKFIKEIKPDVIFSPRKVTLKILRLERLVKKFTQIPVVAFTGDTEYSLKQLRFSPVYWLILIFLRSGLRKNAKFYNLYYTLSEEQARDYSRIFKVRSKTLFKCHNLAGNSKEKNVGNPIRLVYAGKLYCNRWKTLAMIVREIKKINSRGRRMVLEIYTRDIVNLKQKQLLDDGKNSFLMGSVDSKELTGVYKKVDIALHVESFDLRNKLLTKYSFSTKIIDCLVSTCAVMAICWEKHAGYMYLEKEDAAFCAKDSASIAETLKMICENPALIKDYQKKALECVLRNHSKERIQKSIFEDFSKAIRGGNNQTN